MQINQIRLGMLQRLRTEYPYYSSKCLKIRNKEGTLVPFVLNRAQLYLHHKLEEQKKRTGKVRAVVVKGRQQGCSTYIGGRFFHKASLNHGVSVFILAHIAESTKHLFKMTGRFYDNAPEPIRPNISVSNQRNLEFEGLGSEYAIGTAGSSDIGRALTVQCLHGSEVAYWPNSDDIVTGLLQAIPDVKGSELILESTANGVGNLFHSMAMMGCDPESDFQTIFIPWYWQDEYSKEPPANFNPTDEEAELMRLYSLTPGQIYWRRRKIVDVFRGEEWKFQREYPNTLQEAFTTSGETLIPSELVARARKSNIKDPIAPLILGVDPARKGDRTILVFRRGREAWYKKYSDMDEMTLAGIVAQFLDKQDIVKCFIDVGLGYGTLDRLRELGYNSYVTGVHFGSGAINNEVYQNKRAEMFDNMRMWFTDGDVCIPDDDEFCNDLLAIPPLKQTTSRGLLALPPKDEIVASFGKSPDIADALALTFAFPVSVRATAQRIIRKEPEMIRRKSPLATVRNFAGKEFKGSFTI
jgi:hypothetical protein